MPKMFDMVLNGILLQKLKYLGCDTVLQDKVYHSLIKHFYLKTKNPKLSCGMLHIIYRIHTCECYLNIYTVCS